MESTNQKRFFFIDAMSTLFLRKDSVAQNYQVLLAQLGIEISVEEIKKIHAEEYQAIRNQKPSTDKQIPQGEERKFWAKLNAAIIKRISPFFTEALKHGDEIAGQLRGNSDFFELNPEAVDFLEELNLRGIIRVLATNQEKEEIKNLLEHFHLSPLLDILYVSDTAGLWKPNPKFFTKAIKMNSATPDQAAIVGDSFTSDIEAGYQAGIRKLFLFDPRCQESRVERKPFDHIRVAKLTEIFCFL